MPVQIELVAWGGWPNCYRMSNGEVELIVTTDIGPQIMHFGFVGGQNLFKVYDEKLGLTGGDEWHLRGGHRVWLAPEDRVATYTRDNFPVDAAVSPGQITLTTGIDPASGVRKEMIVRLADTGTGVEVVHRLQSCRESKSEFAIWALTVMPEGGVAVTGFPPRARHEDALLPTNPLVMWAFTDLSDPRWGFFERYLVLRQDPAISNPTKLGHFNRKTWGAYFIGGDLFLKRYDADPSRRYPDFGSCYETFTCGTMLEIETLGPLEEVSPGEWIEHTEHWSLHRAQPASFTPDEFDRIIQPILGPWLADSAG